MDDGSSNPSRYTQKKRRKKKSDGLIMSRNKKTLN